MQVPREPTDGKRAERVGIFMCIDTLSEVTKTDSFPDGGCKGGGGGLGSFFLKGGTVFLKK
jgi:hypothetical protein